MPFSFSQFTEDAYRLPEGVQRIAYDADTQRYTFRDRSGQLYQSAAGEDYGVLRPIAAPLPHRRNVTVTEIPDPALREWSQSQKSSKTFDDILPSGYITAAQTGIASPTYIVPSGENLVQATIPKVQSVIEIVRRRTTLKRPGFGLTQSGSVAEDRRRLLNEDASQCEVVQKGDPIDGRHVRSKSEIRPPRYYLRK